jgi:hypothetical protein
MGRLRADAAQILFGRLLQRIGSDELLFGHVDLLRMPWLAPGVPCRWRGELPANLT